MLSSKVNMPAVSGNHPITPATQNAGRSPECGIPTSRAELLNANMIGRKRNAGETKVKFSPPPKLPISQAF
jgi:hypothetical protein